MNERLQGIRLSPNVSREIAGICAVPGRAPHVDAIYRLRQVTSDVFGPDASFTSCGPAIFASIPDDTPLVGRRSSNGRGTSGGANGRGTAGETSIAHMQIAGRVDEWQEGGGTHPALPKGDWCLAFIDVEQRLHLYSDPVGTMPLYYARLADDCVAWSSSLELIVGLADCVDRIDRRYLLGFITDNPPSETTPFLDVRLVRPGHRIIWEQKAGQLFCERWYEPRIDPLRKVSLDECAELMLSAFDRSIERRVARHTRVWAELSGGMDSSAVVCSLAHAARSRPLQIGTVHHFSSMSREWEERRFVDYVDRACGLTTRGVDIDASEPLPPVDWLTPDSLAHFRSEAIAMAKADRSTALFTGRLGDLVMGNDPFSVAVLAGTLAAGPRAFLDSASVFAGLARQPIVSVMGAAVLHYVTDGRLSANAKVSLNSQNSKSVDRSPTKKYSLTETAADDFRHLYTDYSRMAHPYTDMSRRDLLAGWFAWTDKHRLCRHERERDLAVCHPFADLDLMSVALSLPQHVLRPTGKPRALMRRAFIGRMPDEILRRYSKGYAAPVAIRIARRVVPWLASRIEDLHLAEIGLVSRQELRERIAHFNRSTGVAVGNLRRVAMAERWLRERNTQRSVSTHLLVGQQIVAGHGESCPETHKGRR